eukprot:7505896-Pyramimonas_sp.AAC.1
MEGESLPPSRPHSVAGGRGPDGVAQCHQVHVEVHGYGPPVGILGQHDRGTSVPLRHPGARRS